MKIVLNKCYGGFGIKHKYKDQFRIASSDEISRTDKRLIAIIESLGTNEVSAIRSELKVIEIPDNVYYEIIKYDGYEYIVYSLSQITILE